MPIGKNFIAEWEKKMNEFFDDAERKRREEMEAKRKEQHDDQRRGDNDK